MTYDPGKYLKEYHDVCPHCGARHHNRNVAIGEGLDAEVGDITICWKCFEISVFVSNAELRKPTIAEALAYAANPAVVTALEIAKSSSSTTEALKRLRNIS